MKVGVLSFAHVHAGGFARLLDGMEGVEVLAADPDTDLAAPGEVRGREFADRLGVAYADSYEELFAWGPDKVVVCSENVRHRPLVELAAAHGVDVLCEKPSRRRRRTARRWSRRAVPRVCGWRWRTPSVSARRIRRSAPRCAPALRAASSPCPAPTTAICRRPGAAGSPTPDWPAAAP
ncbi:Gfo/Idh/MocA family oxidoreductase [Streptomyces aureus]